MDSDDWIEPQMYERLYEAATAAGTSIAQASRDEIDEDYHKRPDVCTPPEQEVTCTAEDFLKTLLLHQGDCSFCTKLIKKSLFEGHRFPEGKLNEDFRLLVELLCEGERVRILPEQLYHVFYRIGSNTRRKDKIGVLDHCFSPFPSSAGAKEASRFLRTDTYLAHTPE